MAISVKAVGGNSEKEALKRLIAARNMYDTERKDNPLAFIANARQDPMTWLGGLFGAGVGLSLLSHAGSGTMTRGGAIGTAAAGVAFLGLSAFALGGDRLFEGDREKQARLSFAEAKRTYNEVMSEG